MKRAKMLSGLTAALALLGLGIPALAVAGAPSQLDDLSIKVSYADLNIANEQGARVLYTRLQRASRDACDVQSLTVAGSVRRVALAQECYHETLSNAVEKIGSDALTEIHTG